MLLVVNLKVMDRLKVTCIFSSVFYWEFLIVYFTFRSAMHLR